MIPCVSYRDLPPRPALLASGPFPERLVEYPLLVPAVDAVGNTRVGVRMPELQVPTATYTGWNLRSERFGLGDFCVASGSYISFATTRAERVAAKDPRPSIEERYVSRAEYLGQVRQVIRAMVDERLLLAEDENQILQRAEKLGASLRR